MEEVERRAGGGPGSSSRIKDLGGRSGRPYVAIPACEGGGEEGGRRLDGGGGKKTTK